LYELLRITDDSRRTVGIRSLEGEVGRRIPTVRLRSGVSLLLFEIVHPVVLLALQPCEGFIIEWEAKNKEAKK